MKKYIGKFLLTFILLMLPMIVFAKNENSSEIITGTYQFSAIEGNNKQLQNTFVYKDSDFTKSSFKGSKSLETLSIQVAGASLSWYGPTLDKYEIDNSQNDYNIKNFLNQMKFNNVGSNRYYNAEKKENSVGVIIGEKTIIQDGEEYTLLAIIPRSAGYKQEWAGNFTIGNGDIHEGFKSARDEILRFTKYYIEKNNIKGNLKVWTTGYSRGAAISNMVGGFFAGGGIDYFGSSVSITPEDVYCYTIGTPSSIKNGASKNVELSVSANRSGADYAKDTVGEAFTYTKGGTFSVDDPVYGGVRNIISPDDAFSLLPPEAWGFTRYGKVINSYEELYSIDEMQKELKSISEYVHEAYISNGNIKEFHEKKFDLKTLSIVEKENSISQIQFFKDRLQGMVSRVGTNALYKNEYQEALKSAIGTYGMVAPLTGDISENNNMETTELIYPLIYTYLAYASEELQKENRASSEKVAVTMVVEDLLEHLTGQEIERSTFTIDNFITYIVKYLIDNENEPVFEQAVSGIIGIVPNEYQSLLSMLQIFSPESNVIKPDDTEEEKDAKTRENIKNFLKACVYGAAEGTSAYQSYKTPLEARQLLYYTMLASIASDMPELENLVMNDEHTSIDGHGKFEDFVGLLLQKEYVIEKDEDGNVIQSHSNLGELADAKLIELLDNLLQDAIEQSGELYGEDYKTDFQKQFNGIKQNITKVREIISSLFFHTAGEFNTAASLENTITLVDNASLIAMPHFDEIYLALSRTSNRYDDDYECIKGDEQSFNLLKDDELSIVFSFDYYLFIEQGKVYVDGKEVSSDNYKLSKGSTVVTLNASYLKELGEGEHTIVLAMDGKEADASFNVTSIADPEIDEDSSDINTPDQDVDKNNEKAVNPKTGDTIMTYVYLFGISLAGLILIITRKKYVRFISKI